MWASRRLVQAVREQGAISPRGLQSRDLGITSRRRWSRAARLRTSCDTLPPANGSRSPSISATLSGSDGIVTAIFQSPAGSSPRFAGDANTRLSYDALGTWMALPASADWVNLSPDEPDRIVDSEMGKTDVGRILLLADLQIRRTSAN